MRRIISSLIMSMSLSTIAFASTDITVQMHQTAANGIGKSVGTVVIEETKYGLLFLPNLHDLPPGLHGFHIHVNPSCDNDGEAAGGHLDPKRTNHHLGPYNDKGHLGDLPALYVNADGTATLPVLAPKLKHLSTVEKHSLMIHQGGDNYSDEPAKLGGGGSRMFCGVISA